MGGVGHHGPAQIRGQQVPHLLGDGGKAAPGLAGRLGQPLEKPGPGAPGGGHQPPGLYCNAEDYTRPGAPATLGPVVAWMEENSDAFDVNHLITYPPGSGYEHVIHVDFHPERTGDPRGRDCQAGELEAIVRRR